MHTLTTPNRAATVTYFTQGIPLFSIASTVGLESVDARSLVVLLPGRVCESREVYREHMAVGSRGEPSTLWLLRPALGYRQNLEAVTDMMRRLKTIAHPGLDEPIDVGFVDGSLYLGWRDSFTPLPEYVSHSSRIGPRAVGAMFGHVAAGLDRAATFEFGHRFLTAHEVCVTRAGHARLRGAGVLPPSDTGPTGRRPANDYMQFARILAGMVLGNLDINPAVARTWLLTKYPRLVLLRAALGGTKRSSFSALTHELTGGQC